MADRGTGQDYIFSTKPSIIYKLGDINGFVVKYNSTTAITITVGSCEANGKFYTSNSDDSHTMTSLATAFDFHYIYIDDSASTPGGAPTIIDATTEPTYSASKRGWYNGDDRMIGVVASTDAAATVYYFDTVIASNIKIVDNYGARTFGDIATTMNPDGTWQTPNTAESSTKCPVNAIEMIFEARAFDSAAQCSTNLTSYEMATTDPSNNNAASFLGYDRIYSTQVIPLGATRNVRIKGNADDDNTMGAAPIGYAYTR
jgi:hypothetical protein